MKCMFYIANAAQLAGIFGMIYVRMQHKPAKISTKPRVAYIADKQWTITSLCDSKAPENYCVLSYSFLSLAHPFLKYALLNGHWFLLAVLQKSNRKAAPCANFLCFTAIFFYIKIWFMPEHWNMVLEICKWACPELPWHWPAGPPPQAEKAPHSSLSLWLWLIVV